MRYKFLAMAIALLLIAPSVGFFGCVKCQCGEWGDITISSAAWVKTVECGDTIYVPAGIGAVVVSADYLCEPENCGTNYEWLVSAPVGKSGTSDTSPCVFQFEILDECVTVRISAFCGDARCADCSFTVCPSEEECQCGQWGGVTVSAGDWKETTECGGTIYAPSGVGVVEVSTNYFCEPQDCEATYEWQVSVPSGVIYNGTCGTSPCAFEFELPDVCAEVSVSAYCGDTLCDTCTFTICPPQEVCQCGKWGNINISWGPGQGMTTECGETVYVPSGVGAVEVSASYFCEPQGCEVTYEWQVSTTAGVVLDSGMCANGPCLFQVQLTYDCVTVTIHIFCGDTLCDTCTFTICRYMLPPGGGGDQIG